MTKVSAHSILPKKELTVSSKKRAMPLMAPRVSLISLDEAETQTTFYKFFNILIWLIIAIIGIFTVFLIAEIYSRREIYAGRAFSFATSSQENNSERLIQPEKSGLEKAWPYTDFSTSKVNQSEIYYEGPAKDAIPAITKPSFKAAYLITDEDMPASTKGVYVQIGSEAKFYPLNILVWHEVVNDTLQNSPIAVTYCPLTGAVMVFSRQSSSEPMVFGVSGLLYKSNLVMYDEKTKSLWSQLGHKSIAGEFAGNELGRLSFQLLDLEQAKSLNNNLMVLTTNTGFVRDYKNNPYEEYAQSKEVYTEFGISYDQPDYAPKTLIITFEKDDQKYGFLLDELIKDGSVNLKTEDGDALNAKYENGVISIKLNGKIVDDFYTEYWFSWIKSSKHTQLFRK